MISNRINTVGIDRDIQPEWDDSLSWYVIREEFEPEMDIDNSTITGHDDLAPLHPGISYTANFMVSDINGWWDRIRSSRTRRRLR